MPPPRHLARWLAQVRDNSHASVAEMKLNRILGESVDGAAVTRWSGNLLLDLPDNAGAQN
jgi:general secretion pathway protein M